MQADSIPKGANVLIVDDLIATGGSAKAAGELVRKVGGVTAAYLFVVAIPFLKGAEALDAPTYACVQPCHMTCVSAADDAHVLPDSPAASHQHGRH